MDAYVILTYGYMPDPTVPNISTATQALMQLELDRQTMPEFEYVPISHWCTNAREGEHAHVYLLVDTLELDAWEEWYSAVVTEAIETSECLMRMEVIAARDI
jgi:hypothetical protein